jgi:hypothetical protein
VGVLKLAIEIIEAANPYARFKGKAHDSPAGERDKRL